MKPLLDVLVILDALEKEGSFAAASAKLYKTPSALSYTIHKLESDLNIQLLDRSGHRARFTRTGQMLLEKGREVLHIARELEQQAIRLHQGWENTLAISIDMTFPFSRLSPLIEQFYQQRNVARLQFNRGEGWEMLVAGEVDMVLGALHEPPALANFSFSQLGELEQCFVVAAQHPLAQAKEPLSWRTLQRHRAVISSGGWPHGEKQTSLAVFDMASLLSLVCAGLGWAYLPRYLAAPRLEDRQLVEKRVAAPTPIHRAWIGWNEDAFGLAAQWWLQTVLANSAIRQIYNTKIV
jgi:DNA-binding transcriptional LysR family regulator